jgi:hypothetical protein
MTSRIPPMTTPIAGEGGEADALPINSLWYRYILQLQESSGISDAPNNGIIYARQNSAWRQISQFTALSPGLVPPPQTITGTRFLRDDGQWIEIQGIMKDDVYVVGANQDPVFCGDIVSFIR